MSPDDIRVVAMEDERRLVHALEEIAKAMGRAGPAMEEESGEQHRPGAAAKDPPSKRDRSQGGDPGRIVNACGHQTVLPSDRGAVGSCRSPSIVSTVFAGQPASLRCVGSMTLTHVILSVDSDSVGTIGRFPRIGSPPHASPEVARAPVHTVNTPATRGCKKNAVPTGNAAEPSLCCERFGGQETPQASSG